MATSRQPCRTDTQNLNKMSRASNKEILYVGVDNGISGAAVFNIGGKIASSFVMPAQRAGSHNELDVRAWDALMTRMVETLGYRNFDSMVFVVEEPGGSKLNLSALPVMHGVFHAIRAWAALKGVPMRRITPQKWQNKILGTKRPKGMTKDMALAKAREWWPSHDWSDPARPGSKAVNAGIVDAALIAEYVRLEKW